MNPILVFVSIVAVYVSSACPNGTCRHEGVNCIQNCSTQFCLCDVQGFGSVMTTANGTVCYDDFQVFDNDYRCVPNSMISPSPSPSPSPSYLSAPTPCTCTAPGVECIQRCEPYLCLCGGSLVGSMLPTSSSTVCVDGYQVWESSPVCSASQAPSLSICSADGFYCMGQCSMTYYQCSNGLPSPTMLVPYGTVCGITQNNTGELIYPYECPASNLTCSQPGFQCLSNCGTRVQYCVNGEGYALQSVPSGLLCYDNSLVLSSQPMCASNPNQTNAAASFSITILADNSSWSVLSDSAVAASVVDSVMTAGSNTAIYPSMVSVSGAQRILYQSQSSSISRQITIYAPPMWDSAVVMKILNETSGHSLLSDALLFRSYRLAVTTTTTMSSTPTLSPVPNPFYMTSNMSARASDVDSIILGSILGGGLCVAIVFLFVRRFCFTDPNRVKNVEKATAP